jgi:hypothetical protein
VLVVSSGDAEDQSIKFGVGLLIGAQKNVTAHRGREGIPPGLAGADVDVELVAADGGASGALETLMSYFDWRQLVP